MRVRIREGNSRSISGLFAGTHSHLFIHKDGPATGQPIFGFAETSRKQQLDSIIQNQSKDRKLDAIYHQVLQMSAADGECRTSQHSTIALSILSQGFARLSSQMTFRYLCNFVVPIKSRGALSRLFVPISFSKQQNFLHFRRLLVRTVLEGCVQSQDPRNITERERLDKVQRLESRVVSGM